MWFLLLVMVIAGIVFTMPNYIVQIIDKYNEKRKLEEQIVELKKEQDILEKEVEQLNDNEYVAKIARQKYLFSKDGEIIIKVNGQNVENKESVNTTNFVFDIRIVWIILSVLSGLVIIKLIVKASKRRTRHK